MIETQSQPGGEYSPSFLRVKSELQGREKNRLEGIGGVHGGIVAKALESRETHRPDDRADSVGEFPTAADFVSLSGMGSSAKEKVGQF